MKRELVAVALAGGAGSRFWPFTTNKIMWPFWGSTVFDLTVIQQLPKHVERLIIIASPDNVGSIKAFRLEIPHVILVQKDATGMADALLLAKSQLEHTSALVIIADDFVSPELYTQVLAKAAKTNANVVIPGWKSPSYFPGGYIRMNDGKPVGITEKPGADKIPSPYVAVTGQYIHDVDVFLDTLAKTRSNRDDVYELALSQFMKHMGAEIVPYEGDFVSLKYPWHVLDVCEHLSHTRTAFRKGKRVEIHPNVIIEGNVVIEDDVKIYENTKIIGPTYIGKGTIIGNNNMIRDSYIGQNCITGFNTDIARSYIGDGCWFHANYIGDSVLEGNVSMGSGTVLANLRLDECSIASYVKKERIDTGRTKLGAMIGRDVRIGVNASIMPGIKIGAKSFIGAGVVLDQDLSDQRFCSAKLHNYDVRVNTKILSSQRETFRKNL